eukprot:TRINITY_DN2296_c0_g1_i3.p1 TRINITY_DN2296_c0_g1~~TRINITY_DN2296_c0_g1_i3.p1  ORF type:complete len:234 (+),score=34.76 TRINITY_DN2296_c0_g1_i3:277-978(+)
METDDGGWALVTVAGTITTSKRETAQQDEFFPLLDVWGEYDAGSFTSLRSFSKLDLFYGLLRDDGEFMARSKTRYPSNLMIWPVANASRWKNLRAEDNVVQSRGRDWPNLPEVDYLKLSKDGGETMHIRRNGVAPYNNAARGGDGQVGYRWNRGASSSDNSAWCGGAFDSQLGVGALLYWEAYDYSPYASQWFHCDALSFSSGRSSTGGGGSGYASDQDVLFYFRASNPAAAP